MLAPHRILVANIQPLCFFSLTDRLHKALLHILQDFSIKVTECGYNVALFAQILVQKAS